MAERKIPVGIVGVGYWGPNLLRVLHEQPKFEPVICCDLDQAKLQKMQRRYPGLRTTTSWDEFLKAPTEAVVIATPVSTHARLAEQALRSGRHVLIEKPLATSVADGMRLIEAADEGHRVLMVGHTFEFSPPVLHIRDLIRSGELGDLHYISASRVNLGLYQKDIDVLWDLAPHDFSIVLMWLDEVPTHVSAFGRQCVQKANRDVAFVTMKFPSGVVAHVEVSWLAPTKLRRTTVVGSRKMVVYDDTANLEKVKIFDSGVMPKQPETFGEFQLTYRLGQIVSPPLPNDEPLAQQVGHFADCIAQGKQPRTDGWSGVRVVSVLEAAQRSFERDGALVEVANPRLQVPASGSR